MMLNSIAFARIVTHTCYMCMIILTINIWIHAMILHVYDNHVIYGEISYMLLHIRFVTRSTGIIHIKYVHIFLFTCDLLHVRLEVYFSTHVICYIFYWTYTSQIRIYIFLYMWFDAGYTGYIHIEYFICSARCCTLYRNIIYVKITY